MKEILLVLLGAVIGIIGLIVLALLSSGKIDDRINNRE
ncbi:hypothetical protein IGI42_003039 [Enterococcus sp. AZ109]